MASTADVGGVNHASAYQFSFGMMPDKKAYTNPTYEVDERKSLGQLFEKGRKALSSDSGGAGTAGNAMVPVYVDRRIVDLSRKQTPIVEMIPRVTNQGLTADYNVVTEKGDAYTAAEDNALTESNDTYDRKSKQIKYLYAKGRVTGQANAAYPSYMMAGFEPQGSGLGGGSFTDKTADNARQLEVLMKARAMKELEENLIINGDSSTTSTQFDGFIKQQGTTNQVDASSSPISFDLVDEAIEYAYLDGGMPKMAVCAPAVFRQLRRLVIDTFRYNPSDMAGQLPFGVPARLMIDTMVGTIPVIPSRFMTNTAGSREIYFLDTDYIEMRVLQDMTYEEKASTNDSYPFILKIYECLIVRAPQFNAFITNLQ